MISRHCYYQSANSRINNFQGGFTLLEMLIALSIFSLIGLLSVRMVSAVSQNHKIMSENAAQIAKVQRVLTQIDQDLGCLINRSIRQGNNKLAAIAINKGREIEMTRGCIDNVFQLKQSELQRVTYFLQRDSQSQSQQLIRRVWSSLDRADDQTFTDQLLLKNVNHFAIAAITNQGSGQQWPSTIVNNVKPAQLLAITMTIHHPLLGEIERYYGVPW